MRRLLVVLVLVGAACSGSSAKPEVSVEATLTEEVEVSGAYRQGVARVDDGWIFSTNDGLFRVDEQLGQVAVAEPALPAELTDRAFDHIGDVDVAGDVLYAPVEQGDYGLNSQVMARYDAETLVFIDATDVAQAHNAWVAVDPDTMTAYSMSGFGDSTILRYDIEAGWASLEPLLLDTLLDRVQGGDLWGGFLWLATDNDIDGLYRVDLVTGVVVLIGALAHVDGEGEGIDATDLDSGLLHALSIDAELLPVYFQHFRVDLG